MDNFSSNQFCRLYLNGNGAFQPKTIIDSSDKMTTLSNLENIIDCCVDIINDNSGFTAIGWSKRGEINDQRNKDNVDVTERIEPREIGYHVLHMYPKN